ncbi:hypothetical protein OG225_01050 [Nocardia sp. NBC_01377]|uniref:dihydrofolate reductase family protein n=1 Tax=Nocardia sp. NBC_01377 TaxID=2903595 RepID=UPI003249DF2D
MRKITAGLFISLDGIIDDPQDWHFPYFDDEMGAAVNAQLATADTLLLGRETYESFAGAWPEREAAGGVDAGMARALGDRGVAPDLTTGVLHLVYGPGELLSADYDDAKVHLEQQG